MLPNTAVAFNAVGIRKRTGAGVRTQTLPPVTNPGFTEVTYRPLVVKQR